MIFLLCGISNLIVRCRSERLEPIAGKGLDPIFHSLVVSVMRSPAMELVAMRAGLEDNKAGIAINAVAVRCPSVISAVDLDELNLIASIFSREFINDFVSVDI